MQTNQIIPGASGGPADVGGRRVLRWDAVHERISKSRAQVWRDIRAGKFPAPITLGGNSVGWYADEIDAWLAARPRVNYAPAGA